MPEDAARLQRKQVAALLAGFGAHPSKAPVAQMAPEAIVWVKLRELHWGPPTIGFIYRACRAQGPLVVLENVLGILHMYR